MQSANSGTLADIPSPIFSADKSTDPSANRSIGKSANRSASKSADKKPRTLFLLAVLCAISALATSVVQAHHAFATEFDASRPLTFKGKVTKVELINPHSWIHIEVLDDGGNPVTWMIEGGSPNALVRRGVTKSSIPIGSELIVTGYQARDGSNKAVGRNISFADGRELFFEGSRAPGGAEAATP
jgi:hypothetical protein